MPYSHFALSAKKAKILLFLAVLALGYTLVRTTWSIPVPVPTSPRPTDLLDEILKRRIRSTLSYTRWAENEACLARLASSGENFVSMNVSLLLCCLKSIRDAMPLGLSLEDRSTLLSAKFSETFIRTLPARDLPRYGSCAVVSSASSLKKYRYGKEIDSHDAVFRFNAAPTAGFEHLVGGRTTVRLINSQLPYYYKPGTKTFLSKLFTHPDKDLVIFERDEIPATAVGEANHVPVNSKSSVNTSLLWDRSNWKPINKYIKLREQFPNMTYYLIHPVFAIFAMKRLLHYYTDGTFHETSSGFIGVLLASLICDSVTSYEVATNDMSSTQEAYYYGQKFNYRSNWHPLGIERMLLQKIGKCRPGTTTCTISIANAVC